MYNNVLAVDKCSYYEDTVQQSTVLPRANHVYRPAANQRVHIYTSYLPDKQEKLYNQSSPFVECSHYVAHNSNSMEEESNITTKSSVNKP